MRRLIGFTICTLLIASFATAAAALPSPPHTSNDSCIECHDSTGAGVSTSVTEFTTNLPTTVRCKKCHWIGGSLKYGLTHDFTGAEKCSSCHPGADAIATWVGGYEDPASGARFATADSLATGPERIHQIHLTGSAGAPARFWGAGKYCKSCHGPAACDTCHPAPSAHKDHVAAVSGIAAYAPIESVRAFGIDPSPAVARTVNAGVVSVACAASGCHEAAVLAAGAPAKKDCISCHPDRQAMHGYRTTDHMSTTAEADCDGSACHSKSDLQAVHVEVKASVECDSCHAAASGSSVSAAVNNGQPGCVSCHPNPRGMVG
ncbi:MAG: hypothetical protein FDZ75_05545, partial [Actinobacteria bacterium]